jgi:hypothetical protein
VTAADVGDGCDVAAVAAAVADVTGEPEASVTVVGAIGPGVGAIGVTAVTRYLR